MFQLPEDIIRYIYEFDNTKRDTFAKVLHDYERMLCLYRFLSGTHLVFLHNICVQPMLRRMLRFIKKKELRTMYEFMHKFNGNHQLLPKKATKRTLLEIMLFVFNPTTTIFTEVRHKYVEWLIPYVP